MHPEDHNNPAQTLTGKAADRTPLPETLGYLLAHVCKLHRQRAETLLNEIGLHAGQEMVLTGLWEHEGMTQTELAERVMIRPATVTSMLQRLERAGLVERKTDTKDQRISRVYSTEKGRNMEKAVQDMWRILEKESFGCLSTDEQLLLRQLLAKVFQNLSGE